MPILGNDQIFERYRIVRWLGSGGAGESYEAEDRLLLRKVTLKLIHPWAPLSDSARRQFFREMQGISTLNHPYLASVLDYGESDGRLYIARRYVSSGSLLGPNGRLWFRPPLAVADAFKYAHQLAQVLQYIHQHGYLHGSLTFSNVLVLRGPNVEHREDYMPLLVADIGLTNFVRRFGQPQVATMPVSAAPEQLEKHTAPASDQFALAVLLYFWLAGRPPYLGTPDEVEKLKLTRTITPLSILNPGLTPEQDSLILRALTVYPEERHASILAFAEALQASLSTLAPATIAPFSPFPEQESTPHDNPHRILSEFPEATSPEEHAETQQEGAHSDLSTSTSTTFSAEPPTLPGTRSEESQPPAQRHLPSIPSTEPGISPLLAKTDSSPDPQLPVFPAPPETPRLEESAIQAALSLAANEEPATNAEAEPLANASPAVELSEQVNSGSELPQARITAKLPGQVNESSVEQTEAHASAELPEQVNVEDSEAKGQLVPVAEAAIESAEEPTTVEQATQVNGTGTTVAIAEAQPASEDRTEADGHSTAKDTTSTSPCLLISSPYASHTYKFVLTNQEITIGRASGSDLRLEQDNLTSRRHAQLKREGERILIVDRHSHNGVFVNGQRIEAARSYELADGDHIGIGNYELIFRSALGSALSRTPGPSASQSV